MIIDSPYFTILIPAFKIKFFDEAIRSVLAQQDEDFELIILNDASPENIKGVVEKYNDFRIRYYENNKNVGAIRIVENWNKLLSYAKGEFVICMGDDDCLKKNCLSEYRELISKYPDLDIYHGWTEIIDEDSKVWKMQEPRPLRESVYTMMWHRWTGRFNQYIGDFLYRTDVLRKNGGFFNIPLAWASDDITSYIAAGYKGIANTQIPVFQYRQNKYSITSVGGAAEKIEAISLEKSWYNDFLLRKPINETDVIYYGLLKRDMPDFISQKVNYTIDNEVKGKIKNHFFEALNSWFFWFKENKKIGRSKLSMFKLLFNALKFKLFK